MNANTAVSQDIKIQVGISKEDKKVYLDWTTNQNCSEVTHYLTSYSPRPAVEVLIFCKALKAAGLNFRLELIESGNYSRNLKLMSSQYIHTTAETVWYEQAKKLNVYVSLPVFDKETIEKGLFTLPNHPLLKIPSYKLTSQLQNYVGISVGHWFYDWKAMNEITSQVISAPSQASIHRMVAAKRADFCFGEFNQNMTFTMEGIELVNIPNVKIKLAGSRHFIVNKNMENSELIYTNLNKGIELLRAKGEIEKTKELSGVKNTAVKDWILLNPNNAS
ncbi:hypothetical protein [Catenovulum sediminis]|uniref:Solute-binding protein family 3/N-terminal domain-containing protein n=1 Tax=Catenovulum sediminis TaxID=1740262 RepID=A0ABV1RIQ6_9ALTE|nr:hypothetical protein [Catenovulum sediminis]